MNEGIPMELEVTWGRAIRVWWSYLWRSIIAMIVAAFFGGIAGAIVGIIGAILKLPLPAIQVFSGILGVVIGLAISVVPIKLILGKDYGEFRLVLLSNAARREPKTASPAPAPYEL
jgi:hypothetical protein